MDPVSGTQLSKTAHDRLQAELDDLTTRGRVDISRIIERARELGDLSENADYHAAKDDQGKMEARIRQLNALLKDVVIVDEDAAGARSTVGAGSVVSIRYEGDDEVERYLIGSVEERSQNLPVISVDSPLGRAMLDHRAGDRVEYEAPAGPLKVEIVEVGG